MQCEGEPELITVNTKSQSLHRNTRQLKIQKLQVKTLKLNMLIYALQENGLYYMLFRIMNRLFGLLL